MRITESIFQRFPNTEDFLAQYAGEILGKGSVRRVYAMKGHPSFVLKHETHEEGTFQNVAEWLLWNNARYMEEGRRWLAPCAAISPDGTVLIQKRTRPITLEERPERIPIWMTDPKLANWGRYEGRPVMHDYGLTLLTNGVATKRMKKLIDYL